MPDCVFCGIVAGELPSHTVHETDDALAFLDTHPLAAGHTLVVPRGHFERLNDLPPETAQAFYAALQDVIPAVEAATDAPATTVAVNNGPPAGQEIDHVHAHVIPRFEDDDFGPIHALFRDRPTISEDRQEEIAAAIAEAM
ncbi:MAG: HIT family protein [archaeon]